MTSVTSQARSIANRPVSTWRQAPVELSTYEKLLAELNEGKTVKVGNWTISEAKATGRGVNDFVAKVKHPTIDTSDAAETNILVNPGQEGKVDLVVETMSKMELSDFDLSVTLNNDLGALPF